MSSDFHLIVTVAHQKEIPSEWLKQRGVSVVTSDGLRSGVLGLLRPEVGILVVITGIGPGASEEAAHLISKLLRPLFVLNLGTAGIVDRSIPLRQWFTPRRLYGEGPPIWIDTRLPIDIPQRRILDSLITVATPDNDLPGQPGTAQAVDMEAYPQARVFREKGVPFHCLKYSTDYTGTEYKIQYHKNLPFYLESVKRAFAFLDRATSADISVVIPSYNRGHLLRRAIDSVLSQSYRPKKVIVVDDGSEEALSERIHRKGVISVRLPHNYGVSKARNIGVSLSDTEWVAFLDSDDLWRRDKLLRQVQYLKRYPFYQILQCEEIWYRRGRRVNPCKYHRKPLGWAWGPSLKRCLISPSGVLLRRDLFLRFGGFREDLPVCEDYDLWIRLTRHLPVGLEPYQGVVKFGGHDDQLSTSLPAMDRFRVKALLEALSTEDDPFFRRTIAAELKRKAEILYRGAMKRLQGEHPDRVFQGEDVVKYYRWLMEVADRYMEIPEGCICEVY